MRRREVLGALGGAASMWTLPARAQQPASKAVRIGFLGASRGVAPQDANYQTFVNRLRELGFSEGQNLTIEYRSTIDPRGIFVSAADLMRSQPDLIVVTGPEAALQAVVGASRAIPIVFIAVQYDPVERGYISSLARPGGNITGVFLRHLELAAKQVEILTQAFPDRTRLAVLWDALTADQFAAAERAAKSLNLQLESVKLENPPYDLESAFRRAAASMAQMMLVLSSPFFTQHRARIADLAIRDRLPSMFIFKFYVEVGGLMSYGVDFASMFRRTADYVAKILTGTPASELPVEQATRFETVVNLKTAKAIGVEMPTSILLRADQVIE